MNNIIFQPNSEFDFTNVSLVHPQSMNGGTYFTKILMDKKSLYIETPKSLTKQGFIKNGKKMCCDLMFNNGDEEFIHWMENLENTCQKLIYEKKESWFQNQLEMDDIETAFTAPLRVYKSGKFYLLRVNVKMNYSTNLPVIKIYNQYETPLTIEDVKSETEIISILEIQGIKFTSKSFQIEMEIKQAMIMNTDEIFENCLIKSSMKERKLAKNEYVAPFQETNIDLIKLNETDANTNADVNADVNTEENEINMEKRLILERIAEQLIQNESAKQTSVEDKNHLNNEQNIDLEMPLSSANDKHLEIHESSQSSLIFPEELEEFNIDTTLDVGIHNLETITLKKPNQVYYEIYKMAREKAKKAKKEAILAFLEAKNIKKTYMLDDLDESDESDGDVDFDKYDDESYLGK